MNDEVGIENFSRKYLVQKRLVRQYVDHFLEIEEKNKRKELEENQKSFADYNWEAMYREGTLKKLKVKVLDLYIIEEKLKRSREALKQEKIDLITVDIAKKMIEGSKVLDESNCDDDVDQDDFEDGNDENALEEIWEDDSDDDIEGDSHENQEEDESVQEENNLRNLLQTMRYGRTCRTWRGRARAADFPWIEKIFLLLFAKLLWTIYLLFKLSRRQEFSKWQCGALNGFLYLVKHWVL